MGVPGLFDLVRNGIEPVTLDELANKRNIQKVAVDATAWLCIARIQLPVDENKTEKRIPEKLLFEAFKKYSEYKIKVLKRNFRVTMVFDGNATPLKTYMKKEKKRIKGDKDEADEDEQIVSNYSDCEDDNDDDDSNMQATSVHYSVFKWPKKRFIPNRVELLTWLTCEMEVEFIVAPYEADSQLTYLATENIVDAIITQDSDLIAFGCPRIIYKINYETQTCNYYTYLGLKEAKNKHSKEEGSSSSNKYDFSEFTPRMIMDMSILISCDYSYTVAGIGKERAYQLIKKYKNFEAVMSAQLIKMRTDTDGTKKFTEGIQVKKNMQMAYLAFAYQQVYDPRYKKVERLSYVQYDGLIQEVENHIPWFLGPSLKDSSVRAIALGERPSELKREDKFVGREQFRGGTVSNHGKNSIRNYCTLPKRAKK